CACEDGASSSGACARPAALLAARRDPGSAGSAAATTTTGEETNSRWPNWAVTEDGVPPASTDTAGTGAVPRPAGPASARVTAAGSPLAGVVAWPAPLPAMLAWLADGWASGPEMKEHADAVSATASPARQARVTRPHRR